MVERRLRGSSRCCSLLLFLAYVRDENPSDASSDVSTKNNVGLLPSLRMQAKVLSNTFELLREKVSNSDYG
jgi:hypothetical protein